MNFKKRWAKNKLHIYERIGLVLGVVFVVLPLLVWFVVWTAFTMTDLMAKFLPLPSGF